MEIVVGKLAGFCGGVINSIVKTEKLLDEYSKMYCLGELVHNKQVVDKLVNKGLIIVESIDEVPRDEKAIVRAHGISKEVYEIAKDKNIELFDLTCPNVLKIHEEANRLVDEGYFIVLTAQKDHPEAIGTISFCGINSFILENETQTLGMSLDIIGSSDKQLFQHNTIQDTQNASLDIVSVEEGNITL